MRPVAHQALDKRGRVIAAPGGPADEAFRRHAAMALMGLWHVFRKRDLVPTFF